jgi:hypothetical protein
MIILYIYLTCWLMKSVFYERHQPFQRGVTVLGEPHAAIVRLGPRL